jgi:hypothetical protein
MFGDKANLSFSSLANKSMDGESFLNKSGSTLNAFDFLPKTAPFLGTATNQDDTAPEDFKPDDAQFKRPEIQLSEPVKVKTGEENEVSYTIS